MLPETTGLWLKVQQTSPVKNIGSGVSGKPLRKKSIRSLPSRAQFRRQVPGDLRAKETQAEEKQQERRRYGQEKNSKCTTCPTSTTTAPATSKTVPTLSRCSL